MVCLELEVQGQGDGRILDFDGQGGVGGLENWTIFMDVICVSSLRGGFGSPLAHCCKPLFTFFPVRYEMLEYLQIRTI